MYNFNAFTADRLLIVGLLLFVILLGLRFVFARARIRAVEPRQPLTMQRVLLRAMRLVGFGLLALVMILTALIINEDLRTVELETAPAYQDVNVPADLSFKVEEVIFTGGDGIQLSGWYVPSRNGKMIILLHGYGGTRLAMLWHARTLVQAGYGVLLYDERASGESGGTRRSYGWEDGPDVRGALAFLQEREGSSPVGIAGCSIGGQIALQGAILNQEIRAVWADGPADIRAQDSAPPRNILDGLVLVSNYLLDYMYMQKVGIAAPPPMIEQIGSIAPRPVMLVGGGKPLGIFGNEAERVHRYASFAGSNAEVWVIEEATHCDGPEKQPEEYARRLVGFFDAAFRDN